MSSTLLTIISLKEALRTFHVWDIMKYFRTLSVAMVKSIYLQHSRGIKKKMDWKTIPNFYEISIKYSSRIGNKEIVECTKTGCSLTRNWYIFIARSASNNNPFLKKIPCKKKLKESMDKQVLLWSIIRSNVCTFCKCANFIGRGRNLN